MRITLIEKDGTEHHIDVDSMDDVGAVVWEIEGQRRIFTFDIQAYAETFYSRPVFAERDVVTLLGHNMTIVPR